MGDAREDGRVDRGRLVPVGRLHLVGRAKEPIVTGGYNVYPKEIENILESLEAVMESAVALAGFPTQPDGDSNKPPISADGRYVAFFSAATNLVAGDTNAAPDVFLFDRTLATTTERVSVGPGAVQGNGASLVFGQAVSNDGTRVAFESAATNLVAGDTNAARDVFVWTSGTTALVSVNSAGTGPGNGESRVSAISGNGRYVVFESDATNLAANDNNGVTDIFVRDTVSGTTDRLSITSTSGQPTTISTEGAVNRDGTTAAFGSFGLEFVADNPSGFYNVYMLAVP